MNITVILCTYNRGESLRRALHSVAQSTLPSSVDWEVLVVDNNSNDHTRGVFDDFSRESPGRFRYLFEPKPGKSHALNSGIREAHGDVLAFMDDDVVVEPAWLQNLTSALSDPSCAGVGGRILPQWTGPPPPWLPTGERYGLAPLAMFDLGLEPGPLTEAPFGTNMAFRSGVFGRYGGFRTDLGPRPGSEIRNEDTEFGQRLLNAGERLHYEPSAVVYHEVSENRLTRAYFLRWSFDKARAEVREFGIPARPELSIAGVPPHVFRRLAVWTVRWLVTADASRRFAAKLKVWGRVGEIKECYRIAREK
jgi:glycosyltransferase involved in cell wall biosynthesis